MREYRVPDADLNRVSKWCGMWRMKLNASKTEIMLDARLRAVHPQFTRQTLDGTVLKESADLVILGVMLNAKLTFETLIHSVSRAAAQRHDSLRKSRQVFLGRSLLLGYFWSLSCRSRSIAEQCGVQLPIHTLNYSTELSGMLVFSWRVLECYLVHLRSVAVLCMLFQIKSIPMHLLSGALPFKYVGGAFIANNHSFALPSFRTSQHSRTFVPISVSLRNDLGCPVYEGVGLAGFKSKANAFLSD